jgi:hypothetical protein
LKKISIIVLWVFFLFILPLVPSSYADEETAKKAPTKTSMANEAEKAAYTATSAGISQTTQEGLIFGTAAVLMLVFISFTDDSDGQAAWPWALSNLKDF